MKVKLYHVGREVRADITLDGKEDSKFYTYNLTDDFLYIVRHLFIVDESYKKDSIEQIKQKKELSDKYISLMRKYASGRISLDKMIIQLQIITQKIIELG